MQTANTDDVFIIYLISSPFEFKKMIKGKEKEELYIKNDIESNIDKTINLNSTSLINFENKKLTDYIKKTLNSIFTSKPPVRSIPSKNIFYFDISSIHRMSITQMNTLYELSPHLDYFFNTFKDSNNLTTINKEYEKHLMNNNIILESDDIKKIEELREFKEKISEEMKKNKYLDYIPNKIGIYVSNSIKKQIEDMIRKKNTVSNKEVYFITDFATPTFNVYDIFNISDILIEKSNF